MIDTASSPTGIWNSTNAAWYDVTPPEPGLASTVMAYRATWLAMT